MSQVSATSGFGMTGEADASLPSTTERIFTVFVLILSTGAFLNLAFDRGQDLEGGMPALQVVWILIYVATGVLLLRRANEVAVGLKREKWLILIVGLCVLSTMWSDDPLLTARRSIALACTTLFGAYFATCYSLRQQLGLLAASFGSIAAFSLVFQLLGIGTSVDGVPGWIGVFTQKNAFGQNMAVATAIFLVLRVSDKQNKGLQGFCALFGCALVLFSQSVTAILMLGVLLFTLPICQTLRKKPLTVMLVAVIAIPSSLYLAMWTIDNLSSVTEFFGRDPALTGRLPLWIFSVVMALRRPWLGYGYDAFWRGGEGDTWAIWRAMNWQAANAHNGFLEVWLDLGVIGLVILLIGCAIYVKRAVQLLRRASANEAMWPLVFLILLLTSNLTAVSMLSRNSAMWIIYVAVGITSGKLLSEARSLPKTN